jgi:heptaprenyl diphosphate synthase
MNTKRLSRLALLTAMALILFTVEAQFPLPVAIPGVKLGMSNVVTLFAVYRFGRKDAAMILAVRILLGNLVCGTVAAMLYSAAGGLCCLAALCLLRPVVPQAQSWVLGILGAIAHILGQMAVAVYVAGTGAVLLYLPVLLLAAMITGAVTGLAVTLTLRRLPPA